MKFAVFSSLVLFIALAFYIKACIPEGEYCSHSNDQLDCKNCCIGQERWPGAVSTSGAQPVVQSSSTASIFKAMRIPAGQYAVLREHLGAESDGGESPKLFGGSVVMGARSVVL